MNLEIETNCRDCPLCAERRQVVVGRGKIPADVLFIGEAPGLAEDLIGRPFVGLSGRLLDLMLSETMHGLTYYITNSVLCRPPENRQPSRDELAACKRHVERIIAAVTPKVVIFVGKTAEQTYRRNPYLKGVSKFSIYHPAHLLRNGGTASPAYRHNINILTDARRMVHEKDIGSQGSKGRAEKRNFTVPV